MPKGPDDETKMRDDQSAYERGLRERPRPKAFFGQASLEGAQAGARAGARAGGCGLLALTVAALAIIGGAGFGVWWFFFR